MELRLIDIIDDLAILQTQGLEVRGIEMGAIAWNAIEKARALANIERAKKSNEPYLTVLQGGKPARLFGVPLTVAESLGEGVFYLVEPRNIKPPATQISRESLHAGG